MAGQINVEQAPINNAPKSNVNVFDEYAPYIIIGIVTLLFNALAYFTTYMCCIKRKSVNRNGNSFQTINNKIVDEDDVTDVEENDEDEIENLRDDV